MVFGPKTNFFGLKSITDRYSHKEIWRKRFDWLVYFFIIRPRKKNPRRPKSFWILDSTFSLFLLRDLRQSIFRLGLRSTTSRWFTLSGPRTIRRGKDFWWVRKRSHFRLGLFGHYKWRTMVGREPLPHQSVSRSVRSAGHWFASQGLWCTLRVCDTLSGSRTANAGFREQTQATEIHAKKIDCRNSQEGGLWLQPNLKIDCRNSDREENRTTTTAVFKLETQFDQNWATE